MHYCCIFEWNRSIGSSFTHRGRTDLQAGVHWLIMICAGHRWHQCSFLVTYKNASMPARYQGPRVNSLYGTWVAGLVSCGAGAWSATMVRAWQWELAPGVCSGPRGPRTHLFTVNGIVQNSRSNVHFILQWSSLLCLFGQLNWGSYVLFF